MSEIMSYSQENFYIIKEKLQFLNPQFPTIVFLEPYGATISLVEYGINHSINIIALTADRGFCTIPMLLLEKIPLTIKINTADLKILLSLVYSISQHIKIDAVIPGFEYFLPAAVTMSNYLNLPAISNENVAHCRQKDKMRAKLQANSCLTPHFKIISNKSELYREINTIIYPAIIKPIDGAGSVHVRKVKNPEEAEIAALKILNSSDILWGHKLSPAVIIETYIDGDEYSVEGVVGDNKILIHSVTEKLLFDQKEFIEVGHIVNPPLTAEIRNKIVNYINTVIQILELRFCPFHAEVRITSNEDVVLMEIAARLAGDKIGDVLNVISEVNYFENVFAAYLGRPLQAPSNLSTFAGIKFFYRPHTASFKSILGLENLKGFKTDELNFYYKPYQDIPSFPKPLRRLGHVIMHDDNYDFLKNNLFEIDQQILFQ